MGSRAADLAIRFAHVFGVGRTWRGLRRPRPPTPRQGCAPLGGRPRRPGGDPTAGSANADPPSADRRPKTRGGHRGSGRGVGRDAAQDARDGRLGASVVPAASPPRLSAEGRFCQAVSLKGWKGRSRGGVAPAGHRRSTERARRRAPTRPPARETRDPANPAGSPIPLLGPGWSATENRAHLRRPEWRPRSDARGGPIPGRSRQCCRWSPASGSSAPRRTAARSSGPGGRTGALGRDATSLVRVGTPRVRPIDVGPNGAAEAAPCRSSHGIRQPGAAGSPVPPRPDGAVIASSKGTALALALADPARRPRPRPAHRRRG